MEAMLKLMSNNVHPTPEKIGSKADKQGKKLFEIALGASQRECSKNIDKENTPNVLPKIAKTDSQKEDKPAGELSTKQVDAEDLLDSLHKLDSDIKSGEISEDDISSILATLPKQLQAIVMGLLTGNTEFTSEVTEVSKSAQPSGLSELLELLGQEIQTMKDTGEVQEGLKDDKRPADQLYTNPIHTAETRSTIAVEDFQAILEQGLEIVTNVSKIMQSIENGSDMKIEAKKILQMLQKWTSLDSKSGGQLSEQMANMDGIDKNTFKTWQSIVQLFEKRTSIANKQQYAFNARVSTADIAKWLGNMLNENNNDIHRNNSVSHTAISTMPMAKVEQYIIHIHHAQEGQQTEQQQLIDQFQKIMKAADLKQLQNGKTEMNILLKPQNLGELTIRMNQVNGEMMVKILVHTGAAKDMLESNLHQLKHMFSPHQVSVERQDMQVQAGQAAHKEQGNQSFNEQQDDSYKAEHSVPEKNDDEDDFQEKFADVLLNMKV